MAGAIRVVIQTQTDHLSSLAAHVLELQQAGRSVVYATANRPYKVVAKHMEDAGVDTAAVTFIDAVTRADGSRPENAPRNVFFLQSPTMLEMMAMRIEQALALEGGDGHMILDSLNALQLYNGLPLVQEFSHYLINRLRTRGASGDLVVLATSDGEVLQQAISGFTDSAHRLEGKA